MTEFQEKKACRDDDDDLGFSKFPLCREPWENFYILRRGVMPCCYGEDVIGEMGEYAGLWNGEVLQDIRSHLSRGELSSYCRRSPGCPIVQRVIRAEKERGEADAGKPEARGPREGRPSRHRISEGTFLPAEFFRRLFRKR